MQVNITLRLTDLNKNQGFNIIFPGGDKEGTHVPSLTSTRIFFIVNHICSCFLVQHLVEDLIDGTLVLNILSDRFVKLVQFDLHLKLPLLMRLQFLVHLLEAGC